MNDRERIIEKLKKIQQLYERAGTDGEKAAALEAMRRIKGQLDKMGPEPTREHVFTSSASWDNDYEEEFRFGFNNPWSHSLFLALLHKHGIPPYRRPRQKRTTVCARIKSRFCNHVLWPEFTALNNELVHHLNSYADEIIRAAVWKKD